MGTPLRHRVFCGNLGQAGTAPSQSLPKVPALITPLPCDAVCQAKVACTLLRARFRVLVVPGGVHRMLAKWLLEKGVRHSDDMSGIILVSLWRHLNEKAIRLDEHIAESRAYWDRLKIRDKKPARPAGTR
jgi:hypothetical protein